MSLGNPSELVTGYYRISVARAGRLAVLWVTTATWAACAPELISGGGDGAGRPLDLGPPDAASMINQSCTPVATPLMMVAGPPARLTGHRGNDLIHDICADTSSNGNHYWFQNKGEPAGGGHDAEVNGAAFDAIQFFPNDPILLYEYKTTRFDNYSDFLKQLQVNKDITELLDDYRKATQCGYRYTFVVSDRQEYDLLIKAALEGRIPPEGPDFTLGFTPGCLN